MSEENKDITEVDLLQKAKMNLLRCLSDDVLCQQIPVNNFAQAYCTLKSIGESYFSDFPSDDCMEQSQEQ